MNTAVINQIPLALVVEHLGGRYSHTDEKGHLWYYSPFRPGEDQASFKINPEKNEWHDFRLANTFAHKYQGSGGNVLDLWNDYYVRDRRTGIPQSLKELEQLIPDLKT